MTRTIFAAAAALLVAAPAFAAPERTFTRDGNTYTYTSTTKGDTQVLEGKVAQTGESFRLVVHKGWVNGDAAGSRVSFRVPKVADDQVAAR